MKKTIFAGVSALALLAAISAAPASAADIYRGDAAASLKDGPAPSFSWTGFYLGAHVGGAWSDLKVTNVDHYTGAKHFTNSSEGVFGGGTLGYNIQRGALVFGIEADLGGMDLAQTKVQPGSPGGDTKSRLGSGLYGDITGRVGVAADRALFYAKGGFAIYDGAASVADDCTAGACGGNLDHTGKTDTFTGWTVGGGVEYMVRPNWSLKAEYQHFDFGSETVAFTGGERWKNELTVDTAKVGLNYHVSRGYEALK
jgi:outer membrane immunogenic protein